MLVPVTTPPVVVIVTVVGLVVLVIVTVGMVTVIVVGSVTIGVVAVAVAVVGMHTRRVLQGVPSAHTLAAGQALSIRSVLGRIASMLIIRPPQSKLLMHAVVSRQILSGGQSPSLVQIRGRQ